MMAQVTRVPSSFRDPSGFLFIQDGRLYRQVNKEYQAHYDHLISSGLCEKLVESGLLIPHTEVSIEYAQSDDAYKIVRPEPVPFISYPYEWCFSQLQDAALTTLAIQQQALDHGMTLKDSSVYNIQFVGGKPLLIDTLSFEKYREGQPWVAYRQFCQHFLAPLALCSHKDVRLSQLLRIYIDGVPLDLASSLLPFRTRLSIGLSTHIHLHARSQRFYADKPIKPTGKKMSLLALRGLIDSLESTVKRLKWQAAGTQWGEYYEDTNYSQEALEHKKQIVGEFIEEVGPQVVWDLGANIGLFSRLASDRGIQTISFDIDPAAVEQSYLQCRSKGETAILPLVLDLTNPSPGLGWAGQERMPFAERGPADMLLALALIHHLAISNNLPLDRIAGFLSGLCNSLIIEFIPKNDSQAQRLLATRQDVFPNYTQQEFEAIFGGYFAIERSVPITASQRTLYLMRKS